MGVSHLFSIKNIFCDKIHQAFFYFDVAINSSWLKKKKRNKAQDNEKKSTQSRVADFIHLLFNILNITCNFQKALKNER